MRCMLFIWPIIGSSYASAKIPQWSMNGNTTVGQLPKEMKNPSPNRPRTPERIEYITYYYDGVNNTLCFDLLKDSLPAKIQIRSLQSDVIILHTTMQYDTEYYNIDLSSGIYQIKILTVNDDIFSGELLIE